MSFVLLLLLAMSTLVQVEKSAAATSLKKLEANQNALLALNQALGTLQKEMGPDQRISANADILSDPDNDNPIEVKNPYLVGVWDSSGDASNTTIDERKPNLWEIGDGAPDYAGRASTGFRRWLISTPESGSANAIDTTVLATAGLVTFRDSADAMPLLAGGTLQPDDPENLTAALEDKTIWAPLVEIGSGSNTPGRGRMSWAVLDEGVKARLNLTSPDAPNTASERLNYWSSPASIGIDAMGASDEFSTFPRGSQDLGKLISLSQTPSLSGVTVAPDDLGEYYHDLSVSSRSVLANVVDSGLKRDLSTLAALRPPEYQDRRLYSDTNTGHTLNPEGDPYWSALFDFINIYKDPDFLAPGTGNVPAAQMTRSEWFGSPSAPGNGDRAALNKPLQAPTEYRLAPAISKVEFYLSLFALYPHWNDNRLADNGDIPFYAHRAFAGATEYDQATIDANQPRQVFLSVVPSITIHNPYNVPLDLSEMWIVLRDPPIGLKFSRFNAGTSTNPVAMTTRPIALSEMIAAWWAERFGGNTGQLNFEMRMQPDILEPGETKVYSPKVPDPGTPLQEQMNDRLDRQFDMTLAPGFVTSAGLLWYSFNPQAINNEEVEITGTIKDASGELAIETRSVESGFAGPYIPMIKGDGYEDSIQVEVSLIDGTVNPPGADIDAVGPSNGIFSAEIYSEDPGIGLEEADASDGATLVGRYVFDYDEGNSASRGGSVPGSTLNQERIDLIQESASEAYQNQKDGVIAATELLWSDLDQDLGEGNFTNVASSDILPHTFAAVRFSSKVTQDESGVAYHPSIPNVFTNNTSFSGHFNVGEEPSAVKTYDLSLTPLNGFGKGPEISGDNNGKHHSQSGSNGISFATQYEIPLSPIHSLASLQHANLYGGYMPRVTYAVGNSFPHPLIPSDAASTVSPNPNVVDYGFIDPVYVSNARLWDRYYFSSMADQQSILDSSGPRYDTVVSNWLNGTDDAPNASFSVHRPERSSSNAMASPADELIDGIEPAEDSYRKMASYQMMDGGFNINSTSVEAWKALLTTASADLASLEMPAIDPAAVGTLSFDGLTNEPRGAVFSRFRIPNRRDSAEDAPSDLPTLFQTYRELTEAQIETLAEEIVDQVRSRGPFLSLSEFVNRRLSEDERSELGALDAAIDAANLNNNIETTAGRDFDSGNVTYMKDSNYGKDSFLQNPDLLAESTNTARGVATFLTQADILQSIGARLTARSDTFTIRAYGDVLDDSGNVVAKSICEAVVQRVPDYVDAGQSPYHDSNIATVEPDTLSKINERFGRQFKIVEFRWLDPSQI